MKTFKMQIANHRHPPTHMHTLTRVTLIRLGTNTEKSILSDSNQ